MMFSPIFQTIAEAGTDTGKDVMLRLILFFMVAVIFFTLGFLSQSRRGKGKWAKYVFGVLPMAACVWYTMDYFRWATNDFNVSATGMNNSQQMMYKASPFLSVALAVLLVVIGIVLDRREANKTADIL